MLFTFSSKSVVLNENKDIYQYLYVRGDTIQSADFENLKISNFITQLTLVSIAKYQQKNHMQNK